VIFTLAAIAHCKWCRLIFFDAAGKTGGIAARAFDHGKL